MVMAMGMGMEIQDLRSEQLRVCLFGYRAAVAHNSCCLANRVAGKSINQSIGGLGPIVRVQLMS